MKKNPIYLSALLLITICMSSFAFLSNKEKGDPKGVALNFLNALKMSDYEGAKKYGSDKTDEMLDMMIALSSMIPDSVKEKTRAVEFTILKTDIHDNQCLVTYIGSDNKQATETLNLVWGKNDWEVLMTKDDDEKID